MAVPKFIEALESRLLLSAHMAIVSSIAMRPASLHARIAPTTSAAADNPDVIFVLNAQNTMELESGLFLNTYFHEDHFAPRDATGPNVGWSDPFSESSQGSQDWSTTSDISIQAENGTLKVQSTQSADWTNPGGSGAIFWDQTYYSVNWSAFVLGAPGTGFTVNPILNVSTQGDGQITFHGAHYSNVSESIGAFSGVSSNNTIQYNGQTYSFAASDGVRGDQVLAYSNILGANPTYEKVLLTSDLEYQIKTVKSDLSVTGNWDFGTVSAKKTLPVTFTNNGATGGPNITVSLSSPRKYLTVFDYANPADVDFTLSPGESKTVVMDANIDDDTPFGDYDTSVYFTSNASNLPQGEISVSCNVTKPTAETQPASVDPSNVLTVPFKITRTLQNVHIRLRPVGAQQGSGVDLAIFGSARGEVDASIALSELPLNASSGSTYQIELSGSALKSDGSSEPVYADWGLAINQREDRQSQTVIGWHTGVATEYDQGALFQIIKKYFSHGFLDYAGAIIRLQLTLNARATEVDFDGPVQSGTSNRQIFLRDAVARYSQIDGYSWTQTSWYTLLRSVGVDGLFGQVQLRETSSIAWQAPVSLDPIFQQSASVDIGRWLGKNSILQFVPTSWTAEFGLRFGLPGSPSVDFEAGGFSARSDFSGPQISYGGTGSAILLLTADRPVRRVSRLILD